MARDSISQEVSDLRRELTDLNMLLNKMVATNINVHAKVTESLIKMDDLLKEVKDMVELLQVATEMESGPSEIHGLNDLVDSSKSANKSMASIEDYLKKIYRRLVILSQAAPIRTAMPPARKPFLPDELIKMPSGSDAPKKL